MNTPIKINVRHAVVKLRNGYFTPEFYRVEQDDYPPCIGAIFSEASESDILAARLSDKIVKREGVAIMPGRMFVGGAADVIFFLITHPK